MFIFSLIYLNLPVITCNCLENEERVRLARRVWRLARHYLGLKVWRETHRTATATVALS